MLSFIYSGLHCVGYLDHLIKSLTLYNNNLILKLKPETNTKSPPVSIIIPTLNEDPEMVRQTILKAKNVNYDNSKVTLIDSSTNKDIRNKTAIMCNELDINYIY
ncbi:MAG: hypothetical protein ACXVHV_09980, partial [Methanobacterium sp.]